jgi:hypothetical protein
MAGTILDAPSGIEYDFPAAGLDGNGIHRSACPQAQGFWLASQVGKRVGEEAGEFNLS